MIKISRHIIIILGILMPFGLSADKGIRINTSSSLDFELVNGLIIVKAQVDDYLGNFIFDTGSQDILINEVPSKADQSIETANGQAFMEEVQLANFSIGNIKQHNITAYKTDLSQVEQFANIEISGLIGLASFQDAVLEFDFSSQSLQIVPNALFESIDKAGMNKITYQLDAEVPIVEIQFDGKSHRFAFDSGATAHFIDRNTLDTEIAILSENAIDLVSANQENTSSSKCLIDQFKLGNKTYEIPIFYDIDLSEINHSLTEPISGILSMHQLAQNSIIINTTNQEIFYE